MLAGGNGSERHVVSPGHKARSAGNRWFASCARQRRMRRQLVMNRRGMNFANGCPFCIQPAAGFLSNLYQHALEKNTPFSKVDA